MICFAASRSGLGGVVRESGGEAAAVPAGPGWGGGREPVPWGVRGASCAGT